MAEILDLLLTGDYSIIQETHCTLVFIFVHAYAFKDKLSKQTQKIKPHTDFQEHCTDYSLIYLTIFKSYKCVFRNKTIHNLAELNTRFLRVLVINLATK